MGLWRFKPLPPLPGCLLSLFSLLVLFLSLSFASSCVADKTLRVWDPRKKGVEAIKFRLLSHQVSHFCSRSARQRPPSQLPPSPSHTHAYTPHSSKLSPFEFDGVFRFVRFSRCMHHQKNCWGWSVIPTVQAALQRESRTLQGC